MNPRNPSDPSASEGRGTGPYSPEPTPIRKRGHVTRGRRVKLATVMAVEMSTLTEVAERTGIPKTTIHQWMHDPEFEQVRTRTREDMAEEVRIGAHLALEHLVKALPTMEGRDLVFAYEKLSEQLNLQTGHATSRTETRDITDDMAPEVRDALMDDIDAWMKARAGSNGHAE